MEDNDHVKAIGLHPIDQAIGEDDQFTQVSIVVRRHDASGVRMIDELLGAARDLVDDALSVEQRIAL